MNYIIDMNVLRLYSKQERITLTEISSMLGMSNNSVSRYATSSRSPDLHILLHICNTLRVSVESFIHHQDVQPTSVHVYQPETFKPIKYKYNAMEKYREENSMNTTALLQSIRNHCNISADPSTYKRICEQQRAGLEIPLGFLNTFNLPLSYLFDDAQLNDCKRKDLQSMEQINNLTNRIDSLVKENQRLLSQNRRLMAEIRRLKTGTLPVKKAPNDQQEMQRIVSKAIKALTALEGYFAALEDEPQGKEE